MTRKYLFVKVYDKIQKVKIIEKTETRRLILVPITLMYAPSIFEEFTEEIVKYMSPSSPKQISETKSWINKVVAENQTGKSYVMVILKKETNEFIGGCGIHNIDTKTPEFGIWTKESSHGNKYGRETIHALKKWADDNLDYDYIKYPVAVKNIASRKIPESLGGVIDHKYFDHNGSGVSQLLAEYRIYPN
ncbi:MAG: GNAT family N-acetyltransferase [bacterium]